MASFWEFLWHDVLNWLVLGCTGATIQFMLIMCFVFIRGMRRSGRRLAALGKASDMMEKLPYGSPTERSAMAHYWVIAKTSARDSRDEIETDKAVGGWQGYIEFAKANKPYGFKEIHRDKYGILWRMLIGGGVFAYVVEVENATPRNGVKERYYIPVDRWMRRITPRGVKGLPQARTARNAVASTFGLRGGKFRLRAAS